MSESKITRALFKPVKKPGETIKSDEIVHVNFNPVSLQITITNTLDDQGEEKKQFVTKSVAKLTMDLIFDTTDTGEDVRIKTKKLEQFMKPTKEGDKKIPPIVLFEWGTYRFQGLVESYKETIDFFAPSGVPLRAAVNLGLSQQEKVFETNESQSQSDQEQTPHVLEVPTGADQDATNMAALSGNSRAGRDIAAANNLETMRFSAGASLTVSAGVQLGPPVAFASGGAGISLGAGAGLSIGAGTGVSLGGGAGFSFEGGAGISVGGSAAISIGGAASAGVSAGEGAFAGLRASTAAQRSRSLDPTRLFKASESLSLATDSGATFSLGGQATMEGSTSLSADVGASAVARAKIQFD